VRAIANGYAPVPAFSAITPTLGGQFTGGGAFVQSNGTAHVLAARSDALRVFSTGAWSDILTSLATSSRWYFTQFGDRVIFAHGGQLSTYIMATGVGQELSGAPSNAIDVATVRDFVVCLTDDHRVVWSEFNDSEGWTPGENQSDEQPLLDGGAGVRIVGGEYALILQKNCIRRAQYVGGDVVFQFDVISPEIGCMADGSVASIGRLVFFLSERGFQMCNGVEITPIGDEKVNRWFFSQYSREDIEGIWSAIDPRASEVYWAMPGTPGQLVVYNWVLQRWWTARVDVTGAFPGATPNVSIDAIDATYGDLDSIPGSLDDPMFSGGNPMLLLVDGSHVVGTLAGANMEAALTVKNIEPTPGKRSRVRAVRMITDALTTHVALLPRLNRGDAESVVWSGTARGNGKKNVRANGRYIDVVVGIAAGETWSDVQGCEIEFEAGDGR
jgi:hypothetical protein